MSPRFERLWNRLGKLFLYGYFTLIAGLVGYYSYGYIRRNWQELLPPALMIAAGCIVVWLLTLIVNGLARLEKETRAKLFTFVIWAGGLLCMLLMLGDGSSQSIAIGSMGFVAILSRIHMRRIDRFLNIIERGRTNN